MWSNGARGGRLVGDQSRENVSDCDIRTGTRSVKKQILRELDQIDFLDNNVLEIFNSNAVLKAERSMLLESMRMSR